MKIDDTVRIEFDKEDIVELIRRYIQKSGYKCIKPIEFIIKEHTEPFVSEDKSHTQVLDSIKVEVVRDPVTY